MIDICFIFTRHLCHYKRLWPRYSIVFTALAGIGLALFLDFHMPTLSGPWLNPFGLVLNLAGQHF